MSLNLIISNSLGALASTLSGDLQRKRGNVFQPHHIVTQTEGMNNWLKLQIADHNGIAANCLFVSPNEIIQKIYYLVGGEFPNMLSAQNLTWLLYTILGEKSFTKRFAQIAAYYNYDGTDKDLKRMALAEKTADLFDQYQVYRPDWIAQWNTQKPEDLTTDKWQQYLWLRAKNLSGGRLPDKTLVGRFIKEAINSDLVKEKLQHKIPALHIFGLSITTEYHLELLFQIAESIEVTFYLVNPAPLVYWFEDRSEKQLAILSRKGFVDKSEVSTGNTLLTSWGRVIQDTFMMLFKNEALLNSLEEVGVVEPPNNSLLHKIQDDIFNAAGINERNTISIADITDGSLRISSCYTIAREIEVLYNYLVHLVDKKKEALSPRDIVVMVTDIDAYAPYIKAVFRHSPYKFHFTIADESFTNGDTLVSALSSLLRISQGSFKAEEVLQLFDSGYIRRRFGITNLELVRKVVDAANIRFGIKGKMLDETRFVSWEYGLKRIMYGICMSGEDAYTDPERELIFPIDLLEGSESEQVVRFVHFVQVLMNSIQERKQDRTIADWVEYVERLIHNLICEPEEEVDEDYLLLQEQLKNYNVADEFMNEKVGFDIFARSLLQAVSRGGRSGSFAGGGITFCSLIPMRSIPFKVVALLGLNYDAFPRKENAASFDLMEKDKRRRGDRNIKENDKHLFLETVLSARAYLYMSYIGQSAKDNSTLPPSAVVDELIDYIEASCEKPSSVRAAIINKHPLHSFSQRYIRNSGIYPNYLDMKRGDLVKTIDENKQPESLSFDEISLEGLIAFFRHPFKAYYNKVLNIYYEEEDVLLSDTEVFTLNKLQEWTLKPQMLKMPDNELGELKTRLVKTGGLPLKNMADVALHQVEESVIDIKKLFRDVVEDHVEEKIELALTIDHSLMKGTIRNMFGSKLVVVSYAKDEAKQLLDTYIRYLTATANGFDLEVYFLSSNRNATFKGIKIAKTEAVNRLQELVRLYKQGHDSILAYFPAFKIQPAEVDELDEAFIRKVISEHFHNFKFPCTDRYLLNEYENGYFKSANIVEAFKKTGEKLIKPLAELFPEYYK
ncbi:exodeoxyribonuclease V subunit gamma [Segetibacter sp. 3557_3]|uniref:exodeoxyribonuclease V subunit gamma n=1 Tax=Segetibacter sp. 3557_3 TaxID=2547429 RepID=UPI001058BA20|nr:exodeoxyribonuclease V subunit gamma [Segetibacter sp. 3557_3]TDH24172.1 exodeoxyribonuclease V subunit gamma [Segetibacter sp. 3557_3]